MAIRELRSVFLHTCHRNRRSFVSSSTAVNATKSIPPKLQALHKSCELVQRDAASYINLSRLQLALRNLESTTPVIRIALLGLDTSKARQLARLLLTDVLSQKQEWETELDTAKTQGVLLRHGDSVSHPLMQVIGTPSPLLRSHNLEILVSTIDPANPSDFRRAATVPTAQTTKSFSGTVSYITYPVHQTLVLADGVDGCLTLGRCAEQDEMITHTVNLPGVESTNVIDLQQAEQAVAKFRESNTNAVFYEEAWFRSGLPALTEWMRSVGSVEGQLPIASKRLITDILDQAESQLVEPPRQKRPEVEQDLKAWAVGSHRELQERLDEAFASKAWSKLQWWKLFWRADDVSTTMADVVSRNWLVEAEKRLIWLSGRCGTTLPTTISTARTNIQSSTAPTLQAIAQTLLIQTTTVTLLSTALSGLIYVAIPASVYSAAAAGALGLAGSLRYLQRKWEAARHKWEGDLRETGRLILRNTEEQFRATLDPVDDAALRDVSKAREAISSARRELAALET